MQLTNQRLASITRPSTAYRAALGAVGTATNQTLLDYLR